MSLRYVLVRSMYVGSFFSCCHKLSSQLLEEITSPLLLLLVVLIAATVPSSSPLLLLLSTLRSGVADFWISPGEIGTAFNLEGLAAALNEAF